MFYDFLTDFEAEGDWDILLLQEFTKSKDIDVFVKKTEHRVYVATPVEGCSAPCLVINRRIMHGIIVGSEEFTPRAISVLFHWEGWNFRISTAHLAACHSRDAYMSSLQSLQDLIESTKHAELLRKSRLYDRDLLAQPIYNIIGIDAQVSVGTAQTNSEKLVIGQRVAKMVIQYILATISFYILRAR
jgi:hypothetical protein